MSEEKNEKSSSFYQDRYALRQQHSARSTTEADRRRDSHITPARGHAHGGGLLGDSSPV
mgnify:CR=1 FL=1